MTTVTIHGQRIELHGMCRTTVKSRLERGWPPDRAVALPPVKKDRIGLTVLVANAGRNNRREILALCVCACGEFIRVPLSAVRTGKQRTCGHARTWAERRQQPAPDTGYSNLLASFW